MVRLPQVHDTVKQGLITPLVEIAREKGVSAYVGDGTNRWPAAPCHATWRGSIGWRSNGTGRARATIAVAEEGVPVRDIAEVIGAGLGVPVVSLSPEAAADHFGWLALFAGLDMPASSAWTRERLDWQPTGPDLITDLKGMDYRQAAAA